MEKKIGTGNAISLYKICTNMFRKIWVVILCICLSVGVCFFINDDESDDNKEYSITLAVESNMGDGTLQERYYEKELQKFTLNESIKRLFQPKTKEKINKCLKKNGYDNLVASEIPTYEGYTGNETIITFKINSIDREKAEFILKTYTEELNDICGQIETGVGVKEISSLYDDSVSTDEGGFSKKNALLVLVSIILGMAIIGVCILFDEKIYTEKELKSYYFFRKFGVINQKKELSLDIHFLKCYLFPQKMKRILFLESYSGQLNLETIENALTESDFTVKNINDEAFFDVLSICDVICVCVELGKDNTSKLNAIIEKIESIDRRIDGVILCEKS